MTLAALPGWRNPNFTPGRGWAVCRVWFLTCIVSETLRSANTLGESTSDALPCAYLAHEREAFNQGAVKVIGRLGLLNRYELSGLLSARRRQLLSGPRYRPGRSISSRVFRLLGSCFYSISHAIACYRIKHE
jgi:hypothetical protein